MSKVLLLAKETNPVAKAVESVFENDLLFKRLNVESTDPVELDDLDILIIPCGSMNLTDIFVGEPVP